MPWESAYFLLLTSTDFLVSGAFAGRAVVILLFI